MLAEQRRQRRRDRMLMMTLIELLSIMVFVAMAYALASRDEAELSTDWKSQFKQAQAQLADAQKQILALRKDVEEARHAAAVLAEEYTGQPLPIDPAKSWEEVQKLLKTIADKRSTGSQDRQRRIETALNGGGAFGLPACASPASAYTVMLYADETLQALPAWEKRDQKEVASMASVMKLVSAGRLPRGQFSELAKQANIDAGRREACMLRVTARPAESYFHDVYMRQVNELARWFAVRRVGIDGR